MGGYVDVGPVLRDGDRRRDRGELRGSRGDRLVVAGDAGGERGIGLLVDIRWYEAEHDPDARPGGPGGGDETLQVRGHARLADAVPVDVVKAEQHQQVARPVSGHLAADRGFLAE